MAFENIGFRDFSELFRLREQSFGGTVDFGTIVVDGLFIFFYKETWTMILNIGKHGAIRP